jgi:Tol biopolymer transport system component
VSTRIRALIAFGATLAIALISATSAEATFPGTNGRIAFWDFPTGQIYAVNPDGSGLRQLTDVPEGHLAADPAWSPDGSTIAFDKDVTGPVRLWTMRADGSHERRLVGDRGNANDFTPTFTPNGRRIIFTRCVGEPCAIYSIRADGTHRRALTPLHRAPPEVFDFDPSASPDGSQIAFGRFNANGIAAQVFVMDADGAHAHPITKPALEGWTPDWAPDGSRIAFATNGNRPGSNIYSVDPDGSNLEQLSDEPYPNNGFQPSYSPEGDRIAFGSDRNYPDLCCADLFVMHSNGANPTLINTDVANVLGPAWGTAPLLP